MKKPPANADSIAVHNVILGTAGHIDHGKTSLIERLTGINADRLPEERERGMTIDLGFARYTTRAGKRVGVIDVPGHERFVKNMVAGATSIDLVLLIVAADDGVMPQTREHIEIMRLLGQKHGMTVVTKIDLVDKDLRELAVEDIRDTVRGTFLEGAPVLPVSSTTGEGFDAFIDALEAAIARVEPRSTAGVFRMPIQRVFSSHGFGTVITGVPVSGRAEAGDTVEILPIGKTGRLRGIQAYTAAAGCAQAGQSSALNVADIDYKEVHRGMVAATPGQFRFSPMIEARFHYLPSNPRPLRHTTPIRLHTGTAEVLGRIYLLERKHLEPGASALVQFRLDEPVVAAPGDRFILRLYSPMVTIGGGEILDLSRWRLKQGKEHVIEKLAVKEDALGEPGRMILNAIEERGFDVAPEKDPAPGAGIHPERVRECIAALVEDDKLFRAGRTGAVISRRIFEQARAKALDAARDFFASNPRRLAMEKVHLRQALRANEVFFQELLADLESKGELEGMQGESLRFTFHTPRLSESERELHGKLDAAMREGRFSPPRVEEIAEREGAGAAEALAIADLLIEEGALVRLADDVLYHRDALDAARELFRAHLEQAGSMTASEARTIIDSSRRFIIPLLELLDKEGFTVRRGDRRELRKTF